MTISHKEFIVILLVLYVILGGIPMALCMEPLQGGVSTSVELPAVPSELRTGANFNEGNLPPMGTTQGWDRIPIWYAGTWHRETQTNFTPNGPVTQLSRSLDEKQKGEQVDRNGGIWIHFSLPKKSNYESEQFIEYQIMTYREPVLINDTQIIVRYRFMAISVDKRSGQIVKVLQKEEFDTLRPEAQGAFFQDGWLTAYDEQGKQLGSMHGQSHNYQIRPFQPINNDPETGLDLHQDFINYLIAHGLANLVPMDEPAQPSNSLPTRIQRPSF